MDPGLDGDSITLKTARPTTRPGIRRTAIPSSLLLWILPLAFLGIFYFFPMLEIMRASFSRGEAGLVGALAAALTSPSTLSVIAFTFYQAALSTILSLLIGLPGAYLLARYDFRGKSALRALTAVPFVLPTLVVAAAFNALLGPSGWLNLALMEPFSLSEPPIRIMNTLAAILLAHVFYNTTIVLRLVGDFWARLDPTVEEAARVLGANRFQTARLVTFPLLSPAIIAATLLVFLFNFTSFGVILILGGPRFATIEVEIYYQTVSLFNLPLAAALALIQLACTLALAVVYTRLSRRVTRPLAVRSPRQNLRKLRTWRERLGAGILLTVLFALLIMPLAALALRSVSRITPERGQRAAPARGLTLDFYRALSESHPDSLFYAPPTEAISNSLEYAAVTVVLALALGLPAAWALARDRRSRWDTAIDPIIMLPLGTSAVTLGLGFILALSRPPLDLRASPWLVPLAHTLVAFPFVVRILTPSLHSIQPRLREAAAVMGASPLRVRRHIDLPLVGRALLVAAAFAFTISLGEFGATALVARPENPTVPVLIFRFLSQPGALNYGQALALSTILMAVTAAGILAIERLRVADIGEF
ncbi:MAG: iron ABC transporter permease [Anaerolineales bacterium]|nr:iron ABC transporter permease [Anaerolineales bacterium]